MHAPTVPEFLRELIASRLVTSDEAEKYLRNFEYFEAHQAHIEVAHVGRWVAALNDHLYVADSYAQLLTLTSGQSDEDRAFIVHVGSY